MYTFISLYVYVDVLLDTYDYIYVNTYLNICVSLRTFITRSDQKRRSFMLCVHVRSKHVVAQFGAAGQANHRVAPAGPRRRPSPSSGTPRPPTAAVPSTSTSYRSSAWTASRPPRARSRAASGRAKPSRCAWRG